MSKYFRILKFGLAGGLACAAVSAAHAAQEIVLVSDQTQIVNLAEVPSTVIVGNPAIADVTTEGRMLVFNARGFGATNVIALDAEGKMLGEYLVSIVYEDINMAAIYTPTGRITLSCRKDCEPTMRIGDNDRYFDLYNTQAGEKNSLASGQADGGNSGNQAPVSSMVITGAP